MPVQPAKAVFRVLVAGICLAEGIGFGRGNIRVLVIRERRIVVFHGQIALACHGSGNDAPGMGMAEDRAVFLESRDHGANGPYLFVVPRIGWRAQFEPAFDKQVLAHGS